MLPDILMLCALRPGPLAPLEAGYRLHRLDLAENPAAMLAKLGPGCRVVVTSGGRGLERALIDKLPALELVAVAGVGYDAVDLAACRERGIAVTNTPDVLTDDVADVALMLLLASARNLIVGDAHVRSGDWARLGPIPLTHRIAGRRAGIVGLGRIGGALARRCAVLGMQIGYTGRTQQPDAPYPYFANPTALAQWADMLIVVVPGGAATNGLISAEVIAALGPEGTLINIARGSVVDEPALIAALKSRKLGAAGLDVFWNEPAPDPAFAAMDNVVLYPHHASGTVETRDAMDALVVENIRALFAGKPLVTQVV